MTSNTKEKAALIIINVITAAFLAIRFTATIIALRRTAARRKTLGTAALVVACLASWLPARQASRVDPGDALRDT